MPVEVAQVETSQAAAEADRVELRVRDLGLMDYQPVWRAMQKFTDARGDTTPDELWLVQHPPVFTLGQAGRPEHILDAGEIIHLDTANGPKGPNQEKLPGMVIFAVGMVPEISLFKDTGLAIGEDGIIVNNTMETNISGVYSVGDCAQFTSGITGKVISGKLATNAVPMAKVLGFNLLGVQRTYPGFFNGAATKVGKFFVGGTGLSEKSARESGCDTVCGYSESTTRFPIMPDAKPIRVKLIADRNSHRLLGAQIVSGEAVSVRVDLFTFAIQKETTIEELTDLSYSAQPFQSFYPAANIIVSAAEDVLKKLGD